MKAIAYCRVSTADQSEEGVSLAMQKDRIAAWCQGNDYTLEAVFVESVSGGRMDNRPELKAALAMTCKTRGVLIVYSLSRLARSVRDTIAMAERLEKAGANLASLTERIDTNSALGKMVFRLLSTLNEFEKDQLSERTMGAMSHLRRANRRISAKIPFGFDLMDDGETLIQNHEEQETLSKMEKWRLEGMSFAAIATRLTSNGTRTKEGRNWYPATVRAILVRRLKIAA